MKKQFSIQRGFTLIEILIVFTIIGVLTSLGIAAYASYNSLQVVQTSASDVGNMLTTARSRALSQVKPSTCGTNVLSGYQVDLSQSGSSYTLSAVCGSKQPMKTSSLPPQVTFDVSTPASVFFAVSSGTVATPATIKVNGYGRTKTITISGTGNVSIN